MMRLFVAIDLPEDVKDAIADTYRAIPGTKWVNETKLHCTLHFIGEVPETALDNIISALSKIKSAPMTLKIKSTGFFPPRKEPRILWFGIEHPPEFLVLQSKIERACIAGGATGETRKFHPHITVARLNDPHREKIADFIVSNSLFSSDPFEITQFHLYQSHHGKVTTHYEKLVSFDLGYF
ncbi:MAG TPA: RNA 2',3'-cyclic phosphodiesterase [Chitinispirillaceae bacterium]|nr:RNA 2',3'-cyclic phosphodiesterase [Chitinispirillaceae bacterium]